KWFAFSFNGQVANYAEMKAEILADDEYHLSRDVDTEIILHEISRQFAGDLRPSLFDVCRALSDRIDGAFSIALLNAQGEMLIARDPLGIKPMSYARQGNLFAAASESVALLNLGFDPTDIHSLEPGCAIVVSPDGTVEMQRFAEAKRAHCFFEWIYFANVASTMDGRSVYLSRKHLGEELAHYEKEEGLFPIKDDGDTIVVPVPDTSKAAADAMAFALRLPCLEGLIRNRYTGRTFIESTGTRKHKASLKYTPLREVLEGKRVILVEDSIVRSTTMKVLLKRVRDLGKAREIHVRIACPPIVAPCFYGIDMSTINELFAPKFLKHGRLTREAENEMAAELGADSLRYLPVDSIARALGFPEEHLCRACITGEYPTPEGERLYQLAIQQPAGAANGRAYEGQPVSSKQAQPVTMR
ncbi:MAG TPA: amidophosphoribosyltransferase, partial [Pirellulales bacterium]